jgi:hypothetical protein
LGPTAILTVLERLEQYRSLRMANGLARVVRKQVLLGNIGDIRTLLVFCEEMIKWLVFTGPDVFGYGPPPFLSVGELRVDIENDAAKGEDPMLDDLTYAESGDGQVHGCEGSRFNLAGMR